MLIAKEKEKKTKIKTKPKSAALKQHQCISFFLAYFCLKLSVGMG